MLVKCANFSHYKNFNNIMILIRIWSYSLITRLSQYSDLYKTE